MDRETADILSKRMPKQILSPNQPLKDVLGDNREKSFAISFDRLSDRRTA